MSEDEHITKLEREIDSLKSDMEHLQQALSKRQAELLAEQQRSASMKPISNAVSAQPAPPPAPQPAARPNAPSAAADQDYPLLQDIQLTPDAPASARGGNRDSGSGPVAGDSGTGPISGDDRRSKGRKACAFEIAFTEEAHFFAGLSQDISEGGLFIATYHLLPVGTQVKLGFELPDGTRVTARGQVRWVRTPSDDQHRPGLGIAFTQLSEEAARRIAAFCAERPPLYIEM